MQEAMFLDDRVMIDDAGLLGDMEHVLESIYEAAGAQGLRPMMHPPHITENESRFLNKVRQVLKGHERRAEIFAVLFTLFSATTGDDQFAAGGRIDEVLKSYQIDTREWVR